MELVPQRDAGDGGLRDDLLRHGQGAQLLRGIVADGVVVGGYRQFLRSGAEVLGGPAQARELRGLAGGVEVAAGVEDVGGLAERVVELKCVDGVGREAESAPSVMLGEGVGGAALRGEGRAAALAQLPELVAVAVGILAGFGIVVACAHLHRGVAGIGGGPGAAKPVAADPRERLAGDAGLGLLGEHVDVAAEVARLGDIVRALAHDDTLDGEEIDVRERGVLAAAAGALEEAAIHEDGQVGLAETAQVHLVAVTAFSDDGGLDEFAGEDLGEVDDLVELERAAVDELGRLRLGALLDDKGVEHDDIARGGRGQRGVVRQRREAGGEREQRDAEAAG